MHDRWFSDPVDAGDYGGDVSGCGTDAGVELPYDYPSEFTLDILNNKLIFIHGDFTVNTVKDPLKPFNINEILPVGNVSLGNNYFWNAPLNKTPVIEYIPMGEAMMEELINSNTNKMLMNDELITTLSHDDIFNETCGIGEIMHALIPNIDHRDSAQSVRTLCPYPRTIEVVPSPSQVNLPPTRPVQDEDIEMRDIQPKIEDLGKGNMGYMGQTSALLSESDDDDDDLALLSTQQFTSPSEWPNFGEASTSAGGEFSMDRYNLNTDF